MIYLKWEMVIRSIFKRSKCGFFMTSKHFVLVTDRKSLEGVKTFGQAAVLFYELKNSHSYINRYVKKVK